MKKTSFVVLPLAFALLLLADLPAAAAPVLVAKTDAMPAVNGLPACPASRDAVSCIGFFDLGVSLGIDDACFDCPRALAAVGSESGGTIQYPITDRPTEIHAPMGAGFRIDFADTTVVREWIASAIESLDRRRQNNLDLSDEEVGLIRGWLSGASTIRCFADVTPFGIVMVRIDVTNGAESSPSILLNVYRSLEYGAYHVMSARFKRIGANVLTHFKPPQTLGSLTRRRPLTSVSDYDLIPGCFGLAFVTAAQSEEVLKVWSNYETPGKLAPIEDSERGDSYYIGWCGAVLIPQKGLEFENEVRVRDRWWYLMQVAYLNYATGKTLEDLLSSHMKDIVQRRMEGLNASADAELVNQRQILSGAVVHWAAAENISENATERAVLCAYSCAANSGQARNDRIRAITDIVATVEKDLLREVAERRDRRLNKTVLILTAFTFVSVVADGLQIDAYATRHIPRRRWRAAALLGPLLLLLVFLLALV